MKSLTFFAAGEPKGQPRPRAFAFHGKARVFDPGTAEHWKSQIAIAAKTTPCDAFGGPVSVSLIFQFNRPKAHFLKAGLRPTAPKYHLTKPDCDNLAKAVLDALTTLGLWGDDKQVAQLFVAKVYGESPGCTVTIKEIVE